MLYVCVDDANFLLSVRLRNFAAEQKKQNIERGPIGPFYLTLFSRAAATKSSTKNITFWKL